MSDLLRTAVAALNTIEVSAFRFFFIELFGKKEIVGGVKIAHWRGKDYFIKQVPTKEQ